MVGVMVVITAFLNHRVIVAVMAKHIQANARLKKQGFYILWRVLASKNILMLAVGN
jgi:hypothetical protein